MTLSITMCTLGLYCTLFEKIKGKVSSNYSLEIIIFLILRLEQCIWPANQVTRSQSVPCLILPWSHLLGSPPGSIGPTSAVPYYCPTFQSQLPKATQTLSPSSQSVAWLTPAPDSQSVAQLTSSYKSMDSSWQPLLTHGQTSQTIGQPSLPTHIQTTLIISQQSLSTQSNLTDQQLAVFINTHVHLQLPASCSAP